MPHLNSYESFKRKKRKNKNKHIEIKNDFVIEKSSNYGVVIEVRYNDAFVLYQDKVILAKLKNEINYPCNKVIYPGDKILIKNENNNYIITNLIKRKNILSRMVKDGSKLNDNSFTNKIIACNIDFAVIVASFKEPMFHPRFVDRYIMILENSKIPYIIVLNKSDLKTKKEEELLKTYKDIGIKVIETSTYDKTGISELKEMLKEKQAIFVGNSGVGKSSLTSLITGNDNVKINSVGGKTKRGRHTTTKSTYYMWNHNSSIIDTPGIRSLNLSQLKKEEIKYYFSEFKDLNDKCKYKDCIHFKEPINKCAVKKSVLNGIINIHRYESYLRILSDTTGDDYKDVLKEVKNNQKI